MIETLMNYTKLDKDTIVDLLPFVLVEIRNYTNQYFLTKHHLKVIKIENDTVYVDGDVDSINIGDTVELMNSENNTLVYQVRDKIDKCFVMEQPLVDEIGNDDIVMIKLSFKNVNMKTIEKMIKYEVEFGDNPAIKSQSLGGYTVTYSTPDGSETTYPIELYGGVKALKKLNDDYAEYRRKGYVRL